MQPVLIGPPAIRRVATGGVRGATAATLALAVTVALLGCSAISARADERPAPDPAGSSAPEGTSAASIPTSAISTPTSTASIPLRLHDQGPLVAAAQRRLVWLGAEIDQREIAGQRFGRTTRVAVNAFQVKFFGHRNGQVGQGTWQRLGEVAGRVDVLPAACDRHKALCIDMRQRVLRYVVDGQVVRTLDARFGMPGNATARGTFRVRSKSRNHVSRLYRTWMPYAMFFHGGQAVHYSPYFARDGYDGGSHGCVNLRDLKAAAWLFDRVPIGTTVHVY